MHISFSPRDAGRVARHATVLSSAFFLLLVDARAALGPCSLPDLPSCACFTDCSNVGAPWPANFASDIVEVARQTVGLRSCCVQHGGQAYWQVQRQATNAASAEALAFQNPNIETDDDTDGEAWCTETIAYWAARAATPYASGYATDRHHPGSYVSNTGEMRRWYIDEEAIGGMYRGRWIDGTELDQANFQPGVDGPCPGAYQQIYMWEPADSDGDGTSWNGTMSHSQMVDSMVVYRLNNAAGPVQRIDVHMVEGNVGFGDGSGFSRITNNRWYRDIIRFTALGEDDEVLDGLNRKIRGWGINLTSDGDPEFDPARITTVILLSMWAYPAPTGSENSDASHVAQMLSYYAATGGTVLMTSNSSLVTHGGKLPSPANPWVIPQAPHTVDPVYIEVDLQAQHPTPVKAITIDWVDGPPPYFELWWSGVPVSIQKRFITVSSGAPSVPPGTTIPFTVALDPATSTMGFPVRYARVVIPNSSLNRPYLIRGFHYHFFSTQEEDGGGSSPEGDAIATNVGGNAGMPPVLSLSTAVPNPFGALTGLSFELTTGGNTKIDLFDVSGRRVRTLLNGPREAGRHETTWDGRDDAGRPPAAGVYFARLEVNGAAVTRKLVLVR